MKRFTLLKTVSDVIEVIAYIELIGGVMLIAYLMSQDAYVTGIGLFGGIGVFILLWITLTLPTLVTAHLIRLGLAYYESLHVNIEISKDILRELRSGGGTSKQESMEELEFKMWKVNNPNKAIAEYFIEKNNQS